MDGMTQQSINSMATWMADVWSSIENKRLADIAMFSTHDSGMYKIVYPVAGFASAPNTQAQGKPVTEQLRRGARCLDLRIAYWTDPTTIDDPDPKPPAFYCVHYSGYSTTLKARAAVR
jgi:hypothetical protein